MQGVLDELEHQTIKLRKDIQHYKKRAVKSMQVAFTLERASYVLGKCHNYTPLCLTKYHLPIPRDCWDLQINTY